jgi:predicted membrane protein (TIGR00267 family)
MESTSGTIQTLAQRIQESLVASAGNIVFGMEDGTVSIFGLVFGVAASAPDSRAVLLAGATGAAAAAVSMMAGTYLDVSTSQGKARAELSQEWAEIQEHPEGEAQELDTRLQASGFTPTERTAIVAALRAHPEEWLKLEGATELKIGDTQEQNAVVQSLWMFVSDLFAAFVPVIPFALFPLGTARIVSVVITALLLVLLGVGRAKVAQTPLVRTIVQTVGIATAAAAAGLLIGKLVTR